MHKLMSDRNLLAAVVGAAVLMFSACAAVPPPSGAGMDLGRGQDLDLSRYDRVIVDPVEVAFDRNWRPVQTGSHLTLSPQDRDRVQRDIAALFDETFSEELAENDGLRLVDSAGPRTVRITPELVDVYLNSPTPLAQPGSTYVRSVGHVTLHLVFRDAVTGEQILELHDRVRGRDIGLLRTASPVYNTFELARIFEDWAQVVRQDLFRAP